MEPEKLVEIYRGPLLECFQIGSIAIVDDSGLRMSAGDVDFVSYYRSSSKPIQILPLYPLEIDKKYDLTDEELSIMSGSLACSPRQLELVDSIMRKAHISQDILIMLPCYPIWEAYATQYKQEGKPPSKLYHNCIGKHLGLILMQREMGGDPADYWKVESPVQQEILRYLSVFTDVPVKEIRIGWDGCGVPVFAVPMPNLALSYLRLAAPDLISDETLAASAARNVAIIARYPENLMDAEALCGVLCRDDNVISKAGADGVYTFGLKKERIGVAMKVYDGNSANMPLIVREILQQLDYENKETIYRLNESFSSDVINATGSVVGYKKAVFRLV
jgi:L-asparaginase II